MFQLHNVLHLPQCCSCSRMCTSTCTAESDKDEQCQYCAAFVNAAYRSTVTSITILMINTGLPAYHALK